MCQYWSKYCAHTVAKAGDQNLLIFEDRPEKTTFALILIHHPWSIIHDPSSIIHPQKFSKHRCSCLFKGSCFASSVSKAFTLRSWPRVANLIIYNMKVSLNFWGSLKRWEKEVNFQKEDALTSRSQWSRKSSLCLEWSLWFLSSNTNFSPMGHHSKKTHHCI